MKKLIVILALVFLQSCGILAPLIQYQHEWTIEVTYFGGDVGVITKSLVVPYDSIPLELIKDQRVSYAGCLFLTINHCDNLIECDIRSYKILEYTFEPIL